MNEYFEEINGNKYLMVVPNNESKEKILKIFFEELWSETKYLIRLITKSSDDYDEKYIKTKVNWDDRLPLNKTIEIPSKIINVSAIFLWK